MPNNLRTRPRLATAPKRFVVTGAAGGLGRAALAALAERGAEVLAVDVDGAKLAEAAAPHRGRVHAHVADLADDDAAAGLASAAQRTLGDVDGLFNTLAIQGPVRRFRDYPDDEFDRVMRVNVGGVWRACKAILPFLLRRGGVIVNTSSTAGVRAYPELSAYIASKHAINGLTMAVAVEHASEGVRAYALCPGGMDAPMLHEVMDAQYGDRERGMRELAASAPDGVLATPAEVAAVGVWLLADAPAHLNGIVVPVDGAKTARG